MSGNELAFHKDIPFVKTGLFLDQIWFSGGRTGATILRHGGIGEILYYGSQSLRQSRFFFSSSPQSSYQKVFRLSVEIDGVAYYPEFNNTRIFPFGYTSEWSLDGVEFIHELCLLNDAVVQRVKVLANPENKKLSLKWIFHSGITSQSPNRKWTPWEADGKIGVLYSVATDAFSEEECRRQVEEKSEDVRAHFQTSDVPWAETHIGLASNLEITSTVSSNGSKHYLKTTPFEDEAAVFVTFSPEREDLLGRVLELKGNIFDECAQLFASFRKRLADSPQIKIPSSPCVQSCLANIPAVIDSLEVKDIPGGYRAAMYGYWIWLDLFSEASPFVFANDASSLRDMLLLHKSFVDPKLGLPLLMTTRLQPYLGTPFHTQCMYILALYHYYCATGDRETLRACYPFCEWLICKSMDCEVGGSGLIEGAGMPDVPADQDGKDICSSGNSVFYQALRSMEVLAGEMNADGSHPEYLTSAAEYRDTATRCRVGFLHHFYDDEMGYFIDSVSSRDFSKRCHYPLFAILWITKFAEDLLGDHAVRIADFLAKNFTRPHGIGGMVPTWDSAYPGDGNQLLAYYPSWSESFYRSTMKIAGREKELNKWFDDVAWFWQQNTIPEGFTYDAENEGFTTDNPGGKQGFGGQAWYAVFFRCIVGIDVDVNGLVLKPAPVPRTISVKNFVVRGKRVDITLTGRAGVDGVVFNGKQIDGSPVTIPFGDLKKKNTIVV